MKDADQAYGAKFETESLVIREINFIFSKINHTEYLNTQG